MKRLSDIHPTLVPDLKFPTKPSFLQSSVACFNTKLLVCHGYINSQAVSPKAALRILASSRKHLDSAVSSRRHVHVRVHARTRRHRPVPDHDDVYALFALFFYPSFHLPPAWQPHHRQMNSQHHPNPNSNSNRPRYYSRPPPWPCGRYNRLCSSFGPGPRYRRHLPPSGFVVLSGLHSAHSRWSWWRVHVRPGGGGRDHHQVIAAGQRSSFVLLSLQVLPCGFHEAVFVCGG